MPPVRAVHVAPPLEIIVQRHGLRRRREDRGAGDEILRRRGGEFFLRRLLLGDGDVAGGLDEFLELLVGHLRRVHPEAVHINAVNGQRVARDARQAAQRFAGGVAAHRELAAGNPHHALRRGCGRGSFVGNGRSEVRAGRAGIVHHIRAGRGGRMRPRQTEHRERQNSRQDEPASHDPTNPLRSLPCRFPGLVTRFFPLAHRWFFSQPSFMLTTDQPFAFACCFRRQKGGGHDDDEVVSWCVLAYEKKGAAFPGGTPLSSLRLLPGCGHALDLLLQRIELQSPGSGWAEIPSWT